MANLGSLLILFVFCYSVLGLYLFADVKKGGFNQAINMNANFETLSNSFLMMIRISTFGDWHQIMSAYGQDEPTLQYQCKRESNYQDYVDNNYETINCGNSSASFIFFLTFIFFINLVYLKLFIAIILQGYLDTTEKDGRLFNQETSQYFREAWSKFDPDATSFIRKMDYPRLLLDLGDPLGWDPTYKHNYLKQQHYIHMVNIPTRNKGKNYQFMDVLENLAMLMMVNQQIEEYLKQFNIKKTDYEDIKHKYRRDLQKGEKVAEFSEANPYVATLMKEIQNHNIGAHNLEVKWIDDNSPVKSGRRKKVKKYKRVKIKKGQKNNQSDKKVNQTQENLDFNGEQDEDQQLEQLITTEMDMQRKKDLENRMKEVQKKNNKLDNMMNKFNRDVDQNRNQLNNLRDDEDENLIEKYKTLSQPESSHSPKR